MRGIRRGTRDSNDTVIVDHLADDPLSQQLPLRKLLLGLDLVLQLLREPQHEAVLCDLEATSAHDRKVTAQLSTDTLVQLVRAHLAHRLADVNVLSLARAAAGRQGRETNITDDPSARC